MQRILLTLCLIIAIASHAAAQQVQSTAVDLRKPNSDFSFSAAEQTTPTLRAYIRENGGAYTTITNLGAVFFFASNATDEVGMAVTNTTRGADYLEWTLTKNQTAVPGTYFAQIIVTNNAGSLQEWVRGEFVIEDSPGTTAVTGWDWNSTNYATVTWVNEQIATVQSSITGMVTRTEFQNTNTTVNGRIDVLETDKVSVATFNASNSVLAADLAILDTNKVDIGDWQASNALLQASIEDAQGMATMGGDVSGPSTNALVIKLHGVSVPDLGVDAGKDGYTLAYDHDTAGLILSPAAVGGTTISNLVLISGTSTPTSVAYTNVGIYRTIRSGNLPALVLNAGGSDVAYFDLLGITLRSGSIHLLTDFLSINPAAYDGSVTAPAYTWDEDRDLGKYRISYNGDYGEGFCVGSNLVWFWAADGFHLTNGARAFGLNYDDLTNKPSLAGYLIAWAAGAGLTNIGSATSPTGQLNAASIASLLLADAWGLESNNYYRASNPSNHVDATVTNAHAQLFGEAHGIAVVSNLAQSAYDGYLWSTGAVGNTSNSWYSSIAYLIASVDTQRWSKAILKDGSVAWEADENGGGHGSTNWNFIQIQSVDPSNSMRVGISPESEVDKVIWDSSPAGNGKLMIVGGSASLPSPGYPASFIYLYGSNHVGTSEGRKLAGALTIGSTNFMRLMLDWDLDGVVENMIYIDKDGIRPSSNTIPCALGSAAVPWPAVYADNAYYGTTGTNYLYYLNSTNYVAMWADLSAYYLQAVSNGTASAVKTNALW